MDQHQTSNTGTEATQHDVFKVYITLITMGTNLLAAKTYTGSDIKLIIIITAIVCHVVASVAETSFTTTIILNVSGIIAIETLVCIMLDQLSHWSTKMVIFQVLDLLLRRLATRAYFLALGRQTNIFLGTGVLEHDL
ncbi:hypothetical protein Fmac_021566 [Flemingia macrophylla]|uniref:Uncharacterized protein n=1 Tax=Flemingia macrophylla TaxID=520843 RepID=A0ABD1LX96_9FABA